MNAGSIFQRKLRLLPTAAFGERSARVLQWQGPSLPSIYHSFRTYKQAKLDQYPMFKALESREESGMTEGNGYVKAHLETRNFIRK